MLAFCAVERPMEVDVKEESCLHTEPHSRILSVSDCRVCERLSRWKRESGVVSESERVEEEVENLGGLGMSFWNLGMERKEERLLK